MGKRVAALMIAVLSFTIAASANDGTGSETTSDICERLCPRNQDVSQNCPTPICPLPICHSPVIPACPECPSPCSRSLTSPSGSSGNPQSCPEPVCPAPKCPAPRCPTPVCPEPQCPQLQCPPPARIPPCPAITCPEPVCPEPVCPTPVCPRTACSPEQCLPQPENRSCPSSNASGPLPVCPQPVCPTPICPEPSCPACPKLPAIPPCPVCPTPTCPQINCPDCSAQPSSGIGGVPGCRTCLWKILVTYDHFPGIGFYKAYNYKLTWHQANTTCSGDGGHLAVINSQKEANVMKLLFQKYQLGGWIHIGFHDLYEEGRYETVLGTPLSETGYVRWHPGKPDNWGRNEHCGTIEHESLLNDGDCNWKVSFICEASESRVLGI